MKEKNRNILKNAIEKLPEFNTAWKETWSRVEVAMVKKEEMEQKLKTGLPQYKAPEILWVKIEEKMKVQHPVLTNAVGVLPAYIAPADSWKRVNVILGKQARVRHLKIFLRVAVAAIIIFSIGFGINRRKLKSDNDFPVSAGFPAQLNNGADYTFGLETVYNPALCKSNPQICSTELFKSLDKQRIEIEGEILNMEPMIKGGDPQFMKYYYRLVNEQVEIEKRMVRLIIES